MSDTEFTPPDSLDSLLMSSPPGSPLFPSQELDALSQDGGSAAGGSTAMQIPANGPDNTLALPDFRQFANLVARDLRLSAEHRAELEIVAQFGSLNEALIWVAARILVLQVTVDRLQPKEVQYEVPQSLVDKIMAEAINIFLDPGLGAYKTRPNEKLLARIKTDLPQAVLNSKKSLSAVKSKIGSVFIHARNNVKTAILHSFGTFDKKVAKFVGDTIGIYDLTEQVIENVAGSDLAPPINIRIAARVAFLRHIMYVMLSESGNGSAHGYWERIDAELKNVREVKKNDAAKISKVFARALQTDRTLYGDKEASNKVATLGSLDDDTTTIFGSIDNTTASAASSGTAPASTSSGLAA